MLLYTVCSLCPCAVVYITVQRRVCVWVRDIDFCVWVLLTSAVDVVSVRKFPVKVYGLVLICVGLGMSVMGWGMGGWWRLVVGI